MTVVHMPPTFDTEQTSRFSLRAAIDGLRARIARPSRARRPLQPPPVRPITRDDRPRWSVGASGGLEQVSGIAPDAPASRVILKRRDGTSMPLASLVAGTTLILLVSDTMAILPGLQHRIVRRSETLGHGVSLICAAERFQSGLPDAWLDEHQQLHALSGGHAAPVLISLDRRGIVFDVVSDENAIMDWLWNDPRPHSLRATGAISLDEVTA